MEDFGFILSVAFSGADLSRALWLGLVGSLFCTRNLQPLRMTALLFLIDRTWPYIGMALSGYQMSDIAASVAYAAESLPQDATYLITRFGGLYVLCALGYHIRMAIHRGGGEKSRLPVPF